MQKRNDKCPLTSSMKRETETQNIFRKIYTDRLQTNLCTQACTRTPTSRLPLMARYNFICDIDKNPRVGYHILKFDQSMLSIINCFFRDNQSKSVKEVVVTSKTARQRQASVKNDIPERRRSQRRCECSRFVVWVSPQRIRFLFGNMYFLNLFFSIGTS